MRVNSARRSEALSSVVSAGLATLARALGSERRPLEHRRGADLGQLRSAPGLFQTVERARHYRSLNLGFDEAHPKPEHVAVLRAVKTEHRDADPQVRMRFVGHVSGPGSEEVNRWLSRRRALAFYRLAEDLGVTASRLLDRARPSHFSETRPTVTEEDAVTRAMNRRVEVFLVSGGAP